MRIIKLLFLGIVLVMFNIAYLAAAVLPDTIFVEPKLAGPGDTLEITVNVHLHSAQVQGLIVTFEGLPDAFQPAGDDWYTWGENWGQILVNNTTPDQVLVSLTPNDTVADRAVLNASVLGINVDLLVLAQILSSTSGELVTFKLLVPEDFPEGQIDLYAVEAGNVILQYLSDTPVVVTSPIVIAEIPDNNALQLGDSVKALSGGKVQVPVTVANRDTIGSGSFSVDYPSGILTLDSVSAGAKAGGMSFTISSDTALAGGVTLAGSEPLNRATIDFSGGLIPTGGKGTLCTLNFSAAQVGAGVTASLSLASASLKDPSDADLADVVITGDSVGLVEFFFSDTLFVDVKQGTRTLGVSWEGTGIAAIIDGQLHLPIRLKNSVPVTVINFYLVEDPTKTEILSLAEVKTTSRTSGWTASAADSASYVQVVALAGSLFSSLPAGDGEVLTLVYDINADTSSIPSTGIDISLSLAGVQILDNQGNAVGVETSDGIATIDERVPNEAESISQGASLPRSYALAQNHPNPFNPSTTINYQIPEGQGNVAFTLNVYDIRGRLIKTLAEGVKGPGYYSAFWDGTDRNGRQVSSGVYFYRFTSKNYTSTRKMILLK